MAQRASFNLNDGTLPTAVARTFDPVLNAEAQNVIEWVCRAPTDAIGFHRIKLKWTPGKAAPASPAGANPRVLHKLEVWVVRPLLDITAPASGTGVQPVVSKNGDVQSKHIFYLPEHAAKQALRDGVAFARGFLGLQLLFDSVVDFNPPY